MKSGSYHIIFNSSSGNKSDQEALSTVKECFSKANADFEVEVTAPGSDLLEISRAMALSAASNGGTMVAAGGDGTVRILAAECAGKQIPLGIIPLGTFNYFARNLNIPTDISQSIDVILAGHTKKAPLGRVGNQVFINNASLGFYKDLIEARERHKSYFGRFRLVALVSALVMFLRKHRGFTIKLEDSGRERICQTTMLFVSNNASQADDLRLPISACSKEGALGVLLLKEMNPLRTIMFLALSILGEAGSDPKVELFCSDSFRASTRRKMINVVLDGEIVPCPAPLSFTLDTEGVTVLAPVAVS